MAASLNAPDFGGGGMVNYEHTGEMNYHSNVVTALLRSAGAAGKPVGNGEDESGNWKEEDSAAA